MGTSMIAASAQFVSEASATLSRRAAGSAEDVWLKSNMYPDYYLNTFHYQVRHHILTQTALTKAAQQGTQVCQAVTAIIWGESV